MHTDREFYELAQSSPEALLRLITRAPPPCGYLVSSLEVKRAERRSDLVLLPEDETQEVWVVEVQGYEDPQVERRLLEESVMLASDHGLWGRLRTAVIYLTRRHRAVALRADLNPQYARMTDPVRVVLGQIPARQLMALSPALFPVLPLSRITRRGLLSRASTWWAQVCDHLRDRAALERTRELFFKLYAGRFPDAILEQLVQSLEDVMVDMLKTRIGQDILDIGRKEGARTTLVDSIVAVLQARFGSVPEALQQRMADCQDMSRLRAVLQQAATATDLGEVEDALGS